MTRWKFISAAFLLIAAPASAAEAPVRIMMPAYTQVALAALKPMIEARTGVIIDLEPTTTDAIVERLAKGEAGDLVLASKGPLSAPAVAERLASQRDIAVSTVGIGVPDGAPKPKLLTADDLSAFFKAVPSFAYSTNQSGRHIASVFDKLGLTDVMKAKSQTGGGLMGALVLKGEVAAAGQQISELRLAGLKNIVPLPEPYQIRIIVTAGVPKTARNAAGAQKVTAFLASGDAANVYENSGLMPVSK